MRKLKVLDLFSGIGGMSLGLEATGRFETTAFCEMDKDCKLVMAKHWPEVHCFPDVANLKVMGEERKFLVDIETDNAAVSADVDLICGGFPCQDISVGGAGKGIIDGKRSSLWSEYARVINEVQPNWVIIENVGRLTKFGLGIVLKDISFLGYDCEWHIVEATHVGLPHRRERCYIVAHHRGLRLHERLGEARQLQADKEWASSDMAKEWGERQPEPIKVCQILSEGAFDSFRDADAGRESALSDVQRVTDGVPTGLDEADRKRRIKQIGNAVVPAILEVIGERIAFLDDALTY